MESRASEDNLSRTIAANTTNQALTTLRQMLHLGPVTEFEIQMPEIDHLLIADETFSVDSIYSIAFKRSAPPEFSHFLCHLNDRETIIGLKRVFLLILSKRK